jgi:hypothetical protein
MLSEVFWVAFISAVTGMTIKLASMAYRSKCREASCCCVHIIRDIEAEEKEDGEMRRIQLQQSQSARLQSPTSSPGGLTRSPSSLYNKDDDF